jgi:hypothetical protein
MSRVLRNRLGVLSHKPHLRGAATVSRALAAALVVFVTSSWITVVRAEQPAGTEETQQTAPRPYRVDPRVDDLFFYPCNDCHAFMDSNSEERDLEVEEGHPATLEHGSGQIWCFSCHDESDYDRLRNLRAEPIDIDSGYQVCSGCHSRKYHHWEGGAHGKRVSNWRGERQLYSCIECHNPHQPAIAPRAPKSPPPIRAGLKPMKPDSEHPSHDPSRPEWEHLDVR